MKRNIIAVIALEERQWEWAVYQVGGGVPEKISAGVFQPPADGVDHGTGTDRMTAQRDALLAQWREEKISYQGMRLVLGMASSNALMQVIDLPTREPDELREMSALQIEKVSPFASDQTAIAHEVLATTSGESSRVLAAGLNLTRIEQWGDVFREAGLNPERIDLNLCARWKSMPEPRKDDTNDPQRIVHLLARTDGCDAIVTDGGIPILFRELVRRDSMTEQDYSEEIAAQITYSLATCDLEYGPSANCAIRVTQEKRDGPLPELEKTLQQTGVSDVSIQSAREFPDLCESLVRRTTGGRRNTLNLAPSSWRLAEIDRKRRRRIMLTLAAAAAIWGLTLGALYGSLHVGRQRLNQMEQRYAAMEPAYQATTNTRHRVRNLTQYTDQSRSALETLRDISARQPAGINLSSFDYRKGSLIRIAGEADTAALIYDFRNALDDSPLYTELDLSSIARAARSSSETFRMNIGLPSATGGGDTP